MTEISKCQKYVGVNLNFKYPFLYLFISLTGGIISSEHLQFPEWSFSIPLFLAFFISPKFRTLADIFLVTSVFFIGIEISSRSIPTYSKDTTYPIHGRCQEVLTNHHYILSVGEQQFYLNSYYTDTLYSPGDSLYFHGKIVPFRNQTNPGEFSYARYLKQKNIFHQLIPTTTIISTGHSHDLTSFFYRLREKVMKKTSLLTQDSITQHLINALCLGYKIDMDYNFRNLFIDTGTIHLLSVSGLHTGALYLFFLFILKSIGISPRKAELLLLPILWSYACLTGLAPSVVRASTILSFMAIGKAFNRTYIPLNSLTASAFFTLLIQPSALYSMSFLLSYSAYTGILIFYPFLFKLPGTLPPLLSKIYACCCITIAAQLPTLPLAAFYFHTININGFLANLIAVPIATLLLYCAASCFILPLWISQYLCFICERLSHILIKFLQYFVPYSINLRHLYPSSILIILLYGCMIITGYYLFHPKRKCLYASIASYLCVFLYLIFTNLHLSTRKEMVILHYPRQSVILLNYQGFCLPLKNTLDSTINNIPYVRQQKLKVLPPLTGLIDKNLFYDNHQICCSQDTIGILSPNYPVYNPCKTLIISGNLLPRTIFQNIPATLPVRIILDGSCNKYTIAQWNSFCQEHHISLQNTTEIGFIRINLK